MEMRGLMGGFYKISEWIMRLSVTNVLWIICSIPFVFLVGTGLFLSTTEDELFTAFIMAAIVAPFFFFPATAAMFAVARKWVMGEVDVPLFKTYFRGYKENFLQSMFGGLLYTLLFVIMYVNYRFYMNELTSFQLLSFVFIGLIVLLFISMFNYFSMMVHYHMKTFQLLKNAILITIGRPFRSLSTVIMSGAVVFISTRFTFLIPFFMGSIIATVSFYNFFLIYQKLQMQAEKAAAEEEARRSEEEEEDLELARMDGAPVKDESEQAK